jgi:L-aspartate oxidase
MPRYHAQGELAPRDDVARAIFAEIEAGRQPYLDCRAAIGAHFPEEFPTVFQSCKTAGIDPRTQLIPIAPAVHYHMGGIATDSYGQSSLDGLLAVGECSAVGVHGANRLASNSLLEATVFGGRAADYINGRDWTEKKAGTIRLQPWLSMGQDVSLSLRRAMTKNCGVRRSAAKLNALLEHIEELIEHVGRANPLMASKMIASAALARQESRGGHFRDDFPKTKPKPISSYLTYDMLD